MVHELKSKEEFNQVLSEGTVLVDYFATWCGPCINIAPKLAELSKQYEGSIKFCKVDVDILGDLAEEQGISAMPTFKIYKGGNEVESMCGANESGIKAMCDKHK